MNVHKSFSKLKYSFDHSHLCGYQRIVDLIIIYIIGCFIALEVRVIPGSHFTFLSHKAVIQERFELVYFTKDGSITIEEGMNDVESLSQS